MGRAIMPPAEIAVTTAKPVSIPMDTEIKAILLASELAITEYRKLASLSMSLS
jgi:hypothetical protein